MDQPLPAPPASGTAVAPPVPLPARRRRLTRVLIALALAAGALALGYAWWRVQPAALPAGIARSNGRIEAIQVDVATKLPGRVREVLVQEGDLLAAGQVVARMDDATLQAELNQAQAQLAQARHAVTTAHAVVDQRESELELARSTLQRSEELVARGFISAQKLDADRAQMLAARAVLVAARSKVIESQSAVTSSEAAVQRVRTEIGDTTLVAPRAARVQYRLAEPGEVLPGGGKVVSLIDLTDVYMTVFVPAQASGRVEMGAPARIVLDAAPQYVIPATVSFVAAEAQFTPKVVETMEERQKLVFRVKARIDPALLRRYESHVKAGVPGVAYIRIDPNAAWPEALQPKLPP